MSDGRSFAAAFARAVGLDPPTDEEVDEILALAGDAARGSERIAAPVVTWLTGRAGLTPADARRVAQGLP